MVGEELPVLNIDLTTTGIVAAAIATRDYQPVHHDVDRARSLGSETIFVNTHTTAGHLERMVRAWAGPGCVLRSLKFRLGTPNYAGDTMMLRGQVVAGSTQERSVTVELVGTNSRGTHVDGVVVVQLA